MFYRKRWNAKFVFIPLVFTTGSKEERDIVEFVFKYSSRIKHKIYKSEVEDVEFRLEVGDIVYAGNSFDAAVVVVNKSENTQNIKVNLTAVLSFYTGVPAKKLKGYKLQFLLNSNAGISVWYRVLFK